MKNTLILAALLILAPMAARASDLSRDLQVPFDPMTNPFQGVEEKALSAPQAFDLKALLERCAYTPAKYNVAGALTTELNAAISPACANELSLSADQNVLTVKSFGLEIVSWDGSHSDGGDEQALGVYDTEGQRVAVYPSLFADGNVIDGIAHAVSAVLPVSRR